MSDTIKTPLSKAETYLKVIDMQIEWGVEQITTLNAQYLKRMEGELKDLQARAAKYADGYDPADAAWNLSFDIEHSLTLDKHRSDITEAREGMKALHQQRNMLMKILNAAAE